MAGVKGRSGGARPNSGGARVGAGRKPDPKPETVVSEIRDPLEFLLNAMQGTIEPTTAQLRAAIAAAQYTHTKKADGGKKSDQADKAKAASAGKFAPSSAPLRVVGGKR